MPLDSSQQPLCSGIFQNRLLFNGLLARKDTSQIQAVITVSTDDTVSWAPAGKAEEQKSSGESRTKGQKLLPFVRQEMSDAARGDSNKSRSVIGPLFPQLNTGSGRGTGNILHIYYETKTVCIQCAGSVDMTRPARRSRSSELEVVAELEQNQDEGSLIIYWWDPGGFSHWLGISRSNGRSLGIIYMSAKSDVINQISGRII
ncbi:hypothetical protein B0H11DRAFT_1906078 [Mycena galericulata]|nr:hypothetical protein B0H11DRAFT_1906078 [Mycena galericulata]